MTIAEAAREAAKTCGCISREAWRGFRIAILPTDSPDCCIPIALDKPKGKSPMRARWEPQNDDLIAGDWYAINPEKLPRDIRHFVTSTLEEIDKRREALWEWYEEQKRSR